MKHGDTVLLLGGARSGKSARAVALAQASTRPVTYIATARRDERDPEWEARIAHHRRQRPHAWSTIEEPLDIITALRRIEPNGLALIDCMTLWLSNVMLERRDPESETARLLSALADFPGPTILVSNEVGWGIVPEHPLGRAFRDAQGRLNQQLAAVADRVELIVAGIPLQIKPEERR